MKNILILLLVAVITGYVMRIKDGDSLILRSKGVQYEIRLYGIDTPEYNQPGGKEAKKALIELIDNKTVKAEITSAGIRNRAIAKIYLGKKYINLLLVKQGFAHWYKRYAPKDKDLEEAQAEAQKEKRGIWSAEEKPIYPEKWRHPKKD